MGREKSKSLHFCGSPLDCWWKSDFRVYIKRHRVTSTPVVSGEAAFTRNTKLQPLKTVNVTLREKYRKVLVNCKKSVSNADSYYSNTNKIRSIKTDPTIHCTVVKPVQYYPSSKTVYTFSTLFFQLPQRSIVSSLSKQ